MLQIRVIFKHTSNILLHVSSLHLKRGYNASDIYHEASDAASCYNQDLAGCGSRSLFCQASGCGEGRLVDHSLYIYMNKCFMGNIIMSSVI